MRGDIDMNEKLLKPDEVADYLQVSKRSILNFCKEGKIDCIRVGNLVRIPESAVLKFMNDEKEN